MTKKSYYAIYEFFFWNALLYESYKNIYNCFNSFWINGIELNSFEFIKQCSKTVQIYETYIFNSSKTT